MVAKKKRKAAAQRKPKKRAGRPAKKKKARTKPKVQPAADTLDLPPFLSTAEDNPPPPFRPSQPPAIHWDDSLDPTPWMPQMRRNAALLATLGPVEPPLPLGTSDPNALHATMIEQIEALEPEIASLRKHQRRRGIGDNNPPEPVEPAPLRARELDEIRKAMAVLKEQPPAPRAPSAKAKAAVALLTKLAAYLGKQADIFVTEAVKEAGKEIGKRIIQSPLWLPIIHKLPELADTANRWLHSLGPP